MKNILRFLLLTVPLIAAAVGVNDVKVSQATSASPPAYADRFITPTSLSLWGFDSSGHPFNVTLGANLSMSSLGVLTAVGSGGPSVTWGSIGGTLSNQTDLQTALNAKLTWPLTTLGDTIYGGASGAGTRLAGNTAATRKFYRQLGTGSVSAAPVWDTLLSSDVGLGNVENTALSTWPGSANIVTLGTIATGTWSGTVIADAKIASALTGKTYNALTLTPLSTGFLIAGGTTSKTLTVSNTANVSGTNTGDQTITLTGDATGSGTGSFAVNVGSINGVALSGLSTGLLKNTAGTLSQAIAATDYAIPTSGSSVLAGNGAGGFSNVTIGTGLTYSGGTLSASGGAGAGTVTSVGLSMPSGLTVTSSPITTAGTIAVSTSLSGIVKGTGSGFADAISGTDYVVPGALAAIATSGSAADLSGGSIPTGRYGATTIPLSALNATGTPSSTTFVRGDGTWADPTGAAGAPALSYYIIQQADAGLTNAQSLGDLSSGMVKVTSTSGRGVLFTATAGTDYVVPGAFTSSGLTMSTAKLLGRTTASTGESEEITVGSGLTLASGTLTAPGSSPTTTLGDLIVRGLSADARFGVGSDGTVLTADSTQTLGVKWNAISGTGTVTSVAQTVPTGFAISGSPVTSSGTLAIAYATGQAANKVLATPDGTTGTLSERSLVTGDFPVSGVTASTYGDSTHVAQIAIDATGRVTTASNVSISGGGSGTVTSVAATVPSGFSISGSPVTTSGTLAVSYATGQTANKFLATPDGTTGAISERSIVTGDLPTTAVTAASYGDATHVGSFTVDATGRLTAASNVSISGGGSGTVTSVALTVPTGFTVSGSPVTSSGTLAIATTLSGILKGTGSGIVAATPVTDYVPPGGAINSGLTQSSAKLLGRTTASTGALEEIGVGSLLSFGSGTLDFAGGPITGVNITISSGKLAGRTTAATGALEEISIGTGLSMSSGTLTATGAGPSPTTTKGDLIVRSSSADSRLAVGSDTTVLTADSTQTLGVKWAAVPTGTIGGSSGGLDKGLIRANGTLGSTIQGSNTTTTLSDAGELLVTGSSISGYRNTITAQADATQGNVWQLNNLHTGGTFKSQFSFLSNSTLKWAFGNDSNENGTQDFFFYDAVASDYRILIKSTGFLQLHAYGAGNLVTDSSGNISANTGYVTSAIASGSAVSLTTATGANVTSISLGAGTWDVSGNINFAASTATVTGTSGGVTSTTGTVPTDGTEVYSGVQVTLLSENDAVTIPSKRFTLGTTTTVYLVGKCTFSAGSVSAFGSITARQAF